MERLNGPSPDRLLGALGALADPTRLRLVHLLEAQELGVAELCEILRLPQSTVSRHLKTLAEAGFVAARAEGTSRLYRLAELDAGARRLWRAARDDAQGWPALEQDRLRLARRLAARRDEAERFFAGAAGDWERLRAELYGAAFLVEAVLALLPRDLVVADLGCGTGDLASRLARHVAHVHAVDRSAAMLRAARRRVGDSPRVTLHQADLERLPREDASCDAARLVLVLANAPDPRPVLAEARRVLKPGGRAVVVDLSAHADEGLREKLGQARAGFEPADLAALLTAAGLDASAVHSLPPEPSARAPALLLATGERPVAAGSSAARPRGANPSAA
jgi:ArsR family transcriptional regulator